MNEEELIQNCQREKDYLRRNADSIRQQYGTDVLAVYSERVIENDRNLDALFRKLQGRIKNKTLSEDEFVLIGRLDELLVSEDCFDSPEIEMRDCYMGGPKGE